MVEKNSSPAARKILRFLRENFLGTQKVEIGQYHIKVIHLLGSRPLCKFRRKRGLLLFRFAQEEAAREAQQLEVNESRARLRAARQATTRARLGGNGTPTALTPIRFEKDLSRVA